jgi:hypothetical protein
VCLSRTSLKGIQLAKAHIGLAMSRATAETLLDGLLGRVRIVNCDQRATHVVESVALYGSLVDPSREEVTDVDLIVFTRRRQRDADGTSAGDTSGSVPRWPSEEQVYTERAALRTLLAEGHDRLDIEVVDERSDNRLPLPPGATWKRVFP